MSREISEIKRLLSEQASSNQSIAEFCRERGLEKKTFYRWREKYTLQDRKRESGFVLLKSDRKIELELRGGEVLRVAPEDLRQVLEALR